MSEIKAKSPSSERATSVVGEPVAYLTRKGSEERVVLAKFLAEEEQDNESNGWTAMPLFARSTQNDDWQPMDSAPKDGTTIWVLDELYGKAWHYECNWNGIEWYHGFGVAWPDPRPTHWRPLPAPPEIAEAKGSGQ